MQIGLRQVSAETVEWFEAACKGGELTRAALARAPCERGSWRGPSGRPCLASARRMLPLLAEASGVHLPDAAAPSLDVHMRPPSDFPDSPVACAPCDPGALSPDLVTDAADRRRREAMVETRHPEGWRRPPGGQLRYRIRSARHGILGGIGQVVHDNRFLLLPGVRVKGLASEALRMATARVADDRETGYGVRPVLAQTFTGPGMSGPSCRAAGWTCCPEPTSGRRSGVRRAPQRVPGWSGTLHCAGGRAAREYGRSPHPDGRVRRRIAAMGAAWTRRLGAPLPALFPGRAEQAAAYRLLSNGAVTMEHVPESHFEQTVARCRAERLVLAVQDRTTLNHDGLVATSGLDAPGGGGKGTSGILAHGGERGRAAAGSLPGRRGLPAGPGEGQHPPDRRPGPGAGACTGLPGHPGGDGLRPRG